ncbi:cytochrome P450 750A1 isoform X2 [Cryptomeria japonica]|uniref:cytochrome P450 750A1 isoform X2 n=1 Tax=Cryptomeria japonica TaxID=3369 RepID=UPI0027DA1FB4|nr:cytochrome P450 750A1 isoform X2 [Cryptomeria japonica]
MEILEAAWIPLLIVLLIAVRNLRKMSKMVPGPTPLPIIGNLHLISSLPHRSLATLAHKYGPIMTLYFGSKPAIVLSSSEMAQQVLKTHDSIFANRPVIEDHNYILSPYKIASAQYGPYWKLLRRIFIQEILSPKRMDSFKSLRAQEMSAMMQSILETALINAKGGVNSLATDLSKEVTYLTSNILSRITFGKKCYESHLGEKTFKEYLDEVLPALSGFNYRDFIPLLRWLDWHGLKKREAEITKIFNGYFERIVDEHVERRKKSSNLDCEDLVDVLLCMSEDESMEIKITRDHIRTVIFDIDTSGSTLEWAMCELLRNPSAMERAQLELDAVVGRNSMVQESDLPHLQYLQSVVKETLRLYPPGPLLLPHQSMKHCTIAGYEIPQNTRVIINAWAIGRDPTAWEEPDFFKPERFFQSKIDVKAGTCTFVTLL